MMPCSYSIVQPVVKKFQISESDILTNQTLVQILGFTGDLDIIGEFLEKKNNAAGVLESIVEKIGL